MRIQIRHVLLAISLAVIFSGCDHKQQASTARDSATFDANGTAHLTRVVPIPTTVSPEVQAWLESLNHRTHGPETLEQRRAGTDEWRRRASAEARKLYPVNLE